MGNPTLRREIRPSKQTVPCCLCSGLITTPAHCPVLVLVLVPSGRLHRACAICGAWPRPDSAGGAAQSPQFPRRASLMTGCLWNVWLIRVSCPLRALSSSYPVAWIVSTASVVTANTYLPSGRREPLTDPREKPWASGSGALSWLAAPHVCPQPVTAESGVSCVTTGPLEALPGLPTTCPVPFPLLAFTCPSTVTSCDQECCRPSQASRLRAAWGPQYSLSGLLFPGTWPPQCHTETQDGWDWVMWLCLRVTSRARAGDSVPGRRVFRCKNRAPGSVAAPPAKPSAPGPASA